MFTVKMDGVSRQRQDGFFFTRGDSLASDVCDIFCRVAADENYLRVAEVAGFSYKFVYVGVGNRV